MAYFDPKTFPTLAAFFNLPPESRSRIIQENKQRGLGAATSLLTSLSAEQPKGDDTRR